MGPGENAGPDDLENAFQLGKELASRGWSILTGGRNCGVMDQACKGARENGGITIGILPDEQPYRDSEHLEIAIRTGMGSARNSINILSSQVIVVIGMGPGTASEATLAIKAGKPVIFLNPKDTVQKFFNDLGKDLCHSVSSTKEVISKIESLLN